MTDAIESLARRSKAFLEQPHTLDIGGVMQLVADMRKALSLVAVEAEVAKCDWGPLAKALFQIEHDPTIKDQAWFDFQGKAQRLIALMQNQ